MFATIRTEHEDCPGCEAMAYSAAGMASATGSRESAYGDGTHGARVKRVTTPAVPLAEALSPYLPA